MGHGRDISCTLCQRSEETKITGALLTKDEVTAHLNCLLFASGIFCRDSPEFDDLFGFSVKDVLTEANRGKKLTCNHCKKKGATAGCEIRRCQKSYHYPCAVKGGARIIQETKNGKYGIYCPKHSDRQQQTNGSVNGHSSSIKTPQTSKKNPSASGASKAFCLACEEKEGNISLESSSNTIMSYCDKHAPASWKRNTNGDTTAAGSSAYHSDSNSSSSTTCSFSKRRLSFRNKQEETPSKRTFRIISDSSNSDDNEVKTPMEMFAPIESDLDNSANPVPELEATPQVIGKDTENPTAGNKVEDSSKDDNNDEDETIILSDAESDSLLLPVELCIQTESLSFSSAQHSTQTVSSAHEGVLVKPEKEPVKNVHDDKRSSQDAESESLLPPVGICITPESLSLSTAELSTQTLATAHQGYVVKAEGEVVKKEHNGSRPEQNAVQSPGQQTNGSSVPEQISMAPSPSQFKSHNVAGSPPCTSSAISPAPPQRSAVSLCASSPSPVALPLDPEPSINSASFWKNCNAAGCTQAIFTDFINRMKVISNRIQADQASQEEYDLALSVMAASGKLAEFVAKEQEELERKQKEIQKAAAAMKEVVSVLRK